MKKLLLSLPVMLLSIAAHGEIYKWVDKDGSVHYSDTQPEDATIDVEQFLGSSITIDDQGRVMKSGERSATAAPPTSANAAKPVVAKKEKPFEWTVEGVVAYAQKLWRDWAGQPAQITKTSPVPAKEVRPVARKPESLPVVSGPVVATRASTDSAVISNDNMGAILDQIEQERIAKEEAAAAAAEISVEIFTTPWCGYCKKAIAYLELNQVPYEEYDVSANATAALRQKLLGGGRGVPFAVINGEPIQGWSQQAYAQALAKNKR